MCVYTCIMVCVRGCVYVWYVYKADQPESPLSETWRSLCPTPSPSTSLPFLGLSLQSGLGLGLPCSPGTQAEINAHFSERLLNSWVQTSHVQLILCSDFKCYFTVTLSSFIFSFTPSPLLLSEKSFLSLPSPTHIFLSAH